MIKKGTHNSFTFLRPVKWWMRLISFTARCQDIGIKEQYEAGSRIFDLRIRFDRNLHVILAHGFIEYQSRFLNDLNFLNSRDEKIYVRVLYERNYALRNASRQRREETAFIRLCKMFEMEYTNITFFSARRKYDWEILYDFHTQDPDMIDLYSSVTGNKIDDLYPYRYAKKNNAKNISEQEGKHNYIFLDFIEHG